MTVTGNRSPSAPPIYLIPDCGDTDSSAAPSALSMAPISHWTTVGFCNGCPGGAARSMSQGLRVLVSVKIGRPFHLPVFPATPIFASTVRPIAVPDGTVMVRYGTYDPFVLIRSARTIERMIRIGRVAVDADITAIAAQLDLPLCRVVARL